MNANLMPVEFPIRALKHDYVPDRLDARRELLEVRRKVVNSS
jgi:hypothetical protein